MKPNPAESPPACWSKNTQVEALRVELVSSTFYLFPYSQLQLARFDKQGETECLTLRFSDQDVKITGRNLRELGLAFQKFAIEWVRELPARYGTILESDHGIVTGIEVTELSTEP